MSRRAENYLHFALPIPGFMPNRSDRPTTLLCGTKWKAPYRYRWITSEPLEPLADSWGLVHCPDCKRMAKLPPQERDAEIVARAMAKAGKFSALEARKAKARELANAKIREAVDIARVDAQPALDAWETDRSITCALRFLVGLKPSPEESTQEVAMGACG